MAMLSLMLILGARCVSVNADATWTRANLRQMGPLKFVEPELLLRSDAVRPLRGTLYLNDKSKGLGWLLAFEAHASLAVELPLPTGNHESAISPDGTTLAVPLYETGRFNSTEGGGLEGDMVATVDFNTGRARVANVPRSPVGAAKPHGTTWTAEGDMLVTYQLKNSIVHFGMQSVVPTVSHFDLNPTGCRTPHLVHVIPGSSLAVTGCRCTNPGDPRDCNGHLGVMDLASGAVRALPAGGRGSEGLAVTSAGEVWLGNLLDASITVFGFNGKPKKFENLEQVHTISVPFPIRLAYEPVTDTVAVASLDLAAALERAKLRPNGKPCAAETLKEPNLHVFAAGSRKLQGSVVVRTSRRGVVNMEGLHAADGFIFAPGFDTAALAVVNANTLEVEAEVYFPFCSLPLDFSVPSFMSDWEVARAEGQGGWNNWSGGSCPATMRNPWDQRFTVLDGATWSHSTPDWAKPRAQMSAPVIAV